jgi:hypothetical protein
MAIKKAHDVEAEASKEIYQVAQADAENKLATMRDNMFAVHNVGLISGRAQAFGSIKLLSEFLEYKQLAQVIESKDYLKIPGVTSIDDYLEKLGLGRSTAFNNLKLARTLTAEEVQLLGQVGFTRRDLLSYASLPEESRLEIREGKVINIESASREEIKDVIEEIIATSREKVGEAEAQVSAKDKVLKSKQDLLNKQEKDLLKYEKQAAAKGLTPDEDAFLQLMSNKKTSFDGYMLSMDPDFVMERAGEITPRMRAALISTLHCMKMEILAAYDTAVMNYGSPDMNPEVMAEFEAWEKGQAIDVTP